MFRTTPCSSSGESIVSMQAMVYVILKIGEYLLETCTEFK